MTVAKRIRLLKFGLIAINIGEIVMALLDILTGTSIPHVVLIYGTQWAFLNLLILFSLRRLKSEVQS